MLLVKDTNGKIHCAKCNKKLIKSEVVKDRLIPVGICSIPRNEANYVGVCSDCHKERLKKKLVFPNYWSYLNSIQLTNLRRTMIHIRGTLMHEFPESSEALRNL